MQMNWLMVAEGRARLGQKPIARKLHLSSPTPTPPHPPTTRNSPNFPEWATFLFLTIQSWKQHFSCIRVRIKQKFSDKVFLVCRYHDHGWCSIIVATYSQPHLINIADHWTNQPTGQQSNFLLRRHFPLDDWPEPPSYCRLFVHISY